MKHLLYNRNIKLMFFCLGALGLLCGVVYYTTQQHPPKTIFSIHHALEQNNLMPIVIIGSGCAGWSAAIYAARSGMKTLLIEGIKSGGQLVGTSYVENIPGVPKSMGKKIIDTMAQQARSFGATSLAQDVVNVDMQNWPYTVTTQNNITIKALSIIVATGAVPKRLGIPGEEDYWGKGVTTCAICDAAFHKDHDVIVVGGGDSALEQVLQLSAYAKTVKLLVRGSRLRASNAMQHHALSNPKLTVLYNTHLKEIKGNGTHVQSVVISTDSGIQHMDIQGVFLAIGHQPATQLFKDMLKLDQEGYIITHAHTQHTSRPGVFAAGDVHDKWYRQAGVASGNGIKAALDAISFLQSIEFTPQHQFLMASHFFSDSSKPLDTLKSIESLEEFDAFLESSSLPVVVDCYTQWCPACKTLEKILLNLKQELAQKAVIIKVNVQNIAAIAHRYAINSVPTLFVFNKDRVLARYQGSAIQSAGVQQFLIQQLS